MIIVENIDDYKLVVVDTNGMVKYFGKNNEYRFHIEALKDYFYTYYEDLAYKVDADNMKNNEDILIYLNELGNIVFLNSAGYGVCYIPMQVSFDQKKAICDLMDGMLDKVIYIEYNLSKENGTFLHQDFFKYTGEECVEFLDDGVKSNEKCI